MKNKWVPSLEVKHAYKITRKIIKTEGKNRQKRGRIDLQKMKCNINTRSFTLLINCVN